jgi:hypothetical protein
LENSYKIIENPNQDIIYTVDEDGFYYNGHSFVPIDFIFEDNVVYKFCHAFYNIIEGRGNLYIVEVRDTWDIILSRKEYNILIWLQQNSYYNAPNKFIVERDNIILFKLKFE